MGEQIDVPNKEILDEMGVWIKSIERMLEVLDKLRKLAIAKEKDGDKL